jgi:hypothetical protein
MAVGIETTPAFLGGLGELEDHSERGPRLHHISMKAFQIMDCHVDLPRSAALASGDAFGSRVGVGDKLVEPAASSRDRCHKERATLRTDRAGLFRLHGFGYEDLTLC